MTVKIYLVGGAVRDKLLGLKPKDLDYAVEASSYKEMKDFIQKNGKIFLETPEYLTIRAHLNNGAPADYVLCRKDGEYSDGRRPDKVTPGTLFDDLARRDFTINSIAFNEATGEYIDPYGGKEDLKTKTLRCVGDPLNPLNNPLDRFNEDALRVLRAMRFKITKGFNLHTCTENAMYSEQICDKLSRNISMDRKRDELYRCFSFDTIATMQFLQKSPAYFVQAIFNGATGKIWLSPTNKAP
jgi:tRNA nucleotidyltransferase (CCA-adding enzyme)